ncbi:hypothetical protein [Actinokineospora iranica]|uniref:Uncharacterized protein n=1 Tax=Actinokineospora iranica TaxID=1271860 RepID=A0A1G6TBZ5_9PSEU|nr:hypothetical protein [Actinokineospora iranica]SDD26066.1 hypothetical protein SAMN05216174_10952 [Actinokineospora iranica]
MSEEKKTEGLRLSQVVAGALAAATAAVLGSTLGVAGTVIGAAVASVISTVGGALYLKSLDRTRETLVSRVVSHKGTVVSVRQPDDLPETAPATDQPAADHAGAPGDSDDPATTDQAVPEPAEHRRVVALVAGGVLVFVLGMAVVTGLEWVRGEPLSGDGQGTTVGALVNRPARQQPSPAPPTTTVTVTPPTASTQPATPPASTTPESPAPTTTDSASPTTTTTTTSAPPPATVSTTPQLSVTPTPAEPRPTG